MDSGERTANRQGDEGDEEAEEWIRVAWLDVTDCSCERKDDHENCECSARAAESNRKDQIRKRQDDAQPVEKAQDQACDTGRLRLEEIGGRLPHKVCAVAVLTDDRERLLHEPDAVGVKRTAHEEVVARKLGPDPSVRIASKVCRGRGLKSRELLLNGPGLEQLPSRVTRRLGVHGAQSAAPVIRAGTGRVGRDESAFLAMPGAIMTARRDRDERRASQLRAPVRAGENEGAHDGKNA